jgi:hypothetical protein
MVTPLNQGSVLETMEENQDEIPNDSEVWFACMESE